MGSNSEKKPWTNLQNLYKKLSKGIKSDIAILDKWRILTYPISPFNYISNGKLVRHDSWYRLSIFIIMLYWIYIQYSCFPKPVLSQILNNWFE